MRERYWSMYTTIKHKERYYRFYFMRAKRINNFVVNFLLVCSFGGIGSWIILNHQPFSWIWASITAIAQVFQALSHRSPYAKQDAALRFLCPQLSKLLLEIDSDWLKIELQLYSEKRIEKLVSAYQSKYDEISSRYTANLDMPINKSCNEKAAEECINFFKHNYHVQKG